MPEPFDLQLFVGQLSADRGRPIHLLPFDLPPGAPCGLCVTTDYADYLVVRSTTSGAQRDHIVLHEAAHLMLGHRPHPLDEQIGVGQVFRHLDPRVVQGMLGRSAYGTVEEQEAEILASLLGQRAGARRQPVPQPPSDPLVARLGRSLEHHNRG
ncbi:hypothetical protein V6U90_18320 [Micromonospora sp. CPCC 206060]|uniref:hypothetical protein n=1 Tax=Micromonospora sp. CPCC 206060 TaxID=3122406 RepID=UPI002FF352DE